LSQTVSYPWGNQISADALASFNSMEGVYEPIVELRQPVATDAEAQPSLWPGYVLSAVLAALSFGLQFLPVWPFQIVRGEAIKHPISAAILAILVGVLVRNLLPLGSRFKPGCRKIVKKTIPVAIVFMGLGLNLTTIASVGVSALAITVACTILAVLVAVACGRALGLGQRLSLLIGAGTGICGNSAIVAVAPLIDAEDEDMALSVGTINLFGLLTMLVCPVIGKILAMSSETFGVWAGTSIHAVPQVVAAGFAFDGDAGTVATAVKLVRVAMMAPLVMVLTVMYARDRAAKPDGGGQLIVHYARLVPWFVWGFAGASLLCTFGFVPELQFAATGVFDAPQSVSLHEVARLGGKILLTLAMAAIGLEVNIRALASVSARAVLAGFLASVGLMIGSLGLIWLLIGW